MPPQLSVVMSTFNSSRTIERAIGSILNQTFSDFELIIMNDGSTDDTESKILAFTDERIKYHSLVHGGLTRALNFGVLQASAKILARHDSDDWSEPDRFGTQLRCFEEDCELSVVASWHNVVESNGRYLGLKSTATDDGGIKKMLRRRNPFCHGSTAIRKSAFEITGGYDEALLFSQDYDLWLRMAAKGSKFMCIAKPLYNYSISPESIAKGWYKLGYAKDVRHNALQPDERQKFSVDSLPEIGKRRTESLWYYAIGSLALDDGNRRRSIRYFLRCLFKNPLFLHAYFKCMMALLPTVIAQLIDRSVKKFLLIGR